MLVKVLLWGGALYLVFLSLIFIGMVNIVLRMAQGEAPPEQTASPPRESWWQFAPSAVLTLLVLMLGLYIPPVFNDTLQNAAAQVGAGGRTGPEVVETPVVRDGVAGVESRGTSNEPPVNRRRAFAALHPRQPARASVPAQRSGPTESRD